MLFVGESEITCYEAIKTEEAGMPEAGRNAEEKMIILCVLLALMPRIPDILFPADLSSLCKTNRISDQPSGARSAVMTAASYRSTRPPFKQEKFARRESELYRALTFILNTFPVTR